MLQTPAVQLKQFNVQQDPDIKVYPVEQDKQVVADEHVIQGAEQLLHDPDDR